jgi:DNA-binding LacI/PurR family transcriptional regulator
MADAASPGELMSQLPPRPPELRVVSNYQPNALTRPFRGPKSAGAIGVVVTEPTTGLFSDAFYSALLGGISSALAERSLLFVLLAPQSTQEIEATKALLVGKHVDGVIMIGLHTHSPLPTLMRARGIPAVLCGRPRKDVEASWIDCDNREGASQAVKHLLQIGRKKIAVISGDLDMPSASDRLVGYREALAEAGVPFDPTIEEVANYLPDRAHMAMERLMLNHPDLDAVFVASDQMAIAALGVLAQARKRVPEDIAVIGFDDSPYALAASPSLTSVRQPIEEEGREAVHVLMREILEPQEAPRQVVLHTKLVIRASTVGAA